ncbi:MAG: thioesterase [Chitinophagaceae bacterium]|nr:MAG: thioesterase [Chitinophagaceae bacterium]
MARIKLSLPENFKFQTTIQVRISDINYGGHVGNDAILSIVHEARLQFLKSMQYSELDFGGTGLIMADAAIEFKNEAFYNDILTIWVTIADVQKINFDIFYKIEKTIDGKTVPVANAKTGMICFDYEKRKVTAISSLALESIKNV